MPSMPIAGLLFTSAAFYGHFHPPKSFAEWLSPFAIGICMGLGCVLIAGRSRYRDYTPGAKGLGLVGGIGGVVTIWIGTYAFYGGLLLLFNTIG